MKTHRGTPIVTTQTLRWRGGWARLGTWRGSDGLASLTLGAESPPSPEFVGECIERLRQSGYTSVVTNALTAADSLPFVDAGFRVRERLHLLAHDMADIPEAHITTRRARRRDRPGVLALDAQAFEPFWRLDAPGLTDALAATPSSRFRTVRDGEAIAAYGIAGRAGRQGYIQRIAVDPSHRRIGLGRALIADALGWLSRRGARRTVVNTQERNTGAFLLYEACGFEKLPVGLSVLGRDL